MSTTSLPPALAVWAAPTTSRVVAAAQTANRFGVLTYDEALAHGMTPKQVQWAVRTGSLIRLHPGVYAPAGTPDSPGRRLTAACVAAGSDARTSHRSATWLWGVGARVLERPEIVVPRRQAPALEGVIVHRCRDLDLSDASYRLGIPVTNPLRTLVDLGAVAPELVSETLDRAVGARLITVLGALAELDRVGRPGRRGAGVLRRELAARGVSGSRSPSVLEAKTAALIARLGLPEAPVCELIAGEHGEYRLDFPFPRVMLDVEVDGWDVHSSPDARQHDLTRQNRLSALGWCFLRYTWADIVRRPDRTGREIAAVYWARLRSLGS